MLVLDVVSTELSDSERATLTSIVAAQLGAEARLDVVSGDDVKQLIALQGQAQEIGVDSSNCINDACLAELAGALGAGLVVSTRAGKLGDTVVVTIAIFDAAAAKSVSRKLIEATSLGELPARLKPALDELVGPLLTAKPAPTAAPAAAATTTAPGATASASSALGDRAQRLFEAEAVRVCVDEKDAKQWSFCNAAGPFTENEFVRRYRALTGARDLDDHERDRSGTLGVQIGGGIVLATLGAGMFGFGLCILSADCSTAVFGRTEDDVTGVIAMMGTGSVAALGGGVLTTLAFVLPEDGTPLDHSLSEREARAAIDTHNAALAKKLARELGDGDAAHAPP